MSIILSDYLGAILGTIREANDWSLDPLSHFRNPDGSVSARGEGNFVSIEFTALYHFHSSISAKDEDWAVQFFRRQFPNQDRDQLTIEQYQKMVWEYRKKMDEPGEDGKPKRETPWK